jgi:hypothetical protein
MRKASPDDIQQLVMMMTEFYAESPYTLNQQRATEAFTALLVMTGSAMCGSFSPIRKTSDTWW